MRESDYHIWLRDLVGDEPDYYNLIGQLDEMQYTWMFTLDENRSAGGIALRGRYAYEAGVDIDEVRAGPCTVLEMLISVADHMEDFLSCDIPTWFWTLIGNLHLDQFDDRHYDSRGVEFIVMSWLNHHYKKNGEGSIFPLKEYTGDCRNIDIWAQMNAWINENYPNDDDWLG